MLKDVILESGYKEVAPIDVYTNMFRLGEHFIQRKNLDNNEFKANPIALYDDTDRRKKHMIMFEDEFAGNLEVLQEKPFAILNGITYFGRKNIQEHASKMFAMIFDLDGVTDSKLKNLFKGFGEVYPIPYYITLSGHGLHLIYVFEEPISLYPNIKLQLKQLKYGLTALLWNKYTSKEKKPQYQGINQGFRVIGGKTKKDAVYDKVLAFEVWPHPTNLDELNRYVAEEYRIDTSKLYKENKYTLQEAKERFPEWYKERIEEGRERRTYKCNRGLYDWWLEKIKINASFGHRYFCIMMLAIYGVKCGIPYEEVKNDAYGLISRFDSLSAENPFTEADIESALECYSRAYTFFPRKDIERLSAIEIPPQKRNWRKQDVHLELARRRKKDLIDIGEDVKGGRPSKEQIIKNWRKNNPTGTKTQCKNDLGVSYATIKKWWE